ncbi:MAG: TonB-dependent receptor [Deltaproteobacteria bacterium]|nr:TonB-dependent receptor [Deltaproteobacteria bacterium]
MSLRPFRSIAHPCVRLMLLGQVMCAAAGVAAAAGPRPEMLLFEEPQVTAAAKHSQSLAEAPASVTVITRAEIRRFGYRTLAEALRSVRGFYGSYDRNYSYIGARGFLRPSDYNNRILILVNGHTYNDDVYGMGYVGPEFGIDLEAVERIEVVRGPGSALYGGNAVFAVVNVVTATGQEQPGAHAVVETGSLGRKRGQVSLGHVFSNGLDVFASGSVLELDGNRQLYYPEYNDPTTNNGVAREADAERALNFFLSARSGNLSLQGGVNRRDKYLPTGSYAATFNDPDNQTVDGRDFAELRYTQEPGFGVLVTSRVFYDGLRYHGTYAYGSGADRVTSEDFGTSHWLGGEVQAQRELFPGNSLIAGSEFTYHPAATMENFVLPSGEHFVDDRRSLTTWGLYAQDEFVVLPQLTLVGGLRFDRYYDRLEEVSPRAAALWSPLADTRFKLLYGRAFRPPSVYEQYFEILSQDYGYLSNPQLKPERITTYEVIWEQTLWRRTQATVDLYHYDMSDLIDQAYVDTGDPNLVRVQFQNLASARANGAEFELRVPLSDAVNLRASYSLQEVRAAGGQLLPNSPKHLGNVAALFTWPAGIDTGFELQLLGPRQTLAGRQVGTAAVANLHLRYQTPVRGLGVGAGFYNLFDQRYSDPGGSEHVQDRIRQDGFTFRLQLEYGF